MKTTKLQYMDEISLVNALNATTLFFASIEPVDDNGDDNERNVWVDASDGHASWSIWIYNSLDAVHPYEVHFMPSTDDGWHVDNDRCNEYAADTMVDVLRCILEDWQSIHY